MTMRIGDLGDVPRVHVHQCVGKKTRDEFFHLNSMNKNLFLLTDEVTVSSFLKAMPWVSNRIPNREQFERNLEATGYRFATLLELYAYCLEKRDCWELGEHTGLYAFGTKQVENWSHKGPDPWIMCNHSIPGRGCPGHTRTHYPMVWKGGSDFVLCSEHQDAYYSVGYTGPSFLLLACLNETK